MGYGGTHERVVGVVGGLGDEDDFPLLGRLGRELRYGGGWNTFPLPCLRWVCSYSCVRLVEEVSTRYSVPGGCSLVFGSMMPSAILCQALALMYSVVTVTEWRTTR